MKREERSKGGTGMSKLGVASLIVSLAALGTLGAEWTQTSRLRRDVADLEKSVARLQDQIQKKSSESAGRTAMTDACFEDLIKLKGWAQDLAEFQKSLGTASGGNGNLTQKDLEGIVRAAIDQKLKDMKRERIAEDMKRGAAHNEKLAATLGKDLRLSDAQKQQLGQILKEQLDAYSDMLLGDTGEGPDRVLLINQATTDKIKAILTEEQRKLWQPQATQYFLGGAKASPR